jgi:hypothetical protein
VEWRSFAGEARSVRQGQAHLLALAEGNGMGHRPDSIDQVWVPCFWTFHSVGATERVHMPVATVEEMYSKEIRLAVAVARHDSGLTTHHTVHLGFQNDTDPITHNLKLRGRLE